MSEVGIARGDRDAGWSDGGLRVRLCRCLFFHVDAVIPLRRRRLWRGGATGEGGGSHGRCGGCARVSSERRATSTDGAARLLQRTHWRSEMSSPFNVPCVLFLLPFFFF